MGSRDDDERRPDPDALLERVRAEEEEAKRAKLRIWFGASPGVGKTYTMLENAQRLRREGVDVVVGIVETHGRKETADLMRGLEQLPRKALPYRGRTLEELDLDGALARKPAVILLDELAHTNAPGSRHQKRWQDAMELLEAGIEVHTTLNVQHVESLNDVVAQITHIRVRETVPDAIVERADEIELVDIPPEVLLERMREGKVYVSDQIERATGHFFKVGNLHALRELALRLTAERVDQEVEAWRRQQGIETTWAARERVMVCVGPSPGSARLVRAARRMAAALHGPWIAAYVERAGAGALREADRTRLAIHLRLAESLGAEVVVVSGDRPADALLELARHRNITRILVGKPTHARWRDFVYGSLLDDLVRGSGDIDVQVIAGEPEEAGPPARPERLARPTDLAAYLKGTIPIMIAGGLSALLVDVVELADIAMLFLVAISVTAALLGRGPSLLASALAVAIFDFFFVPPFYTFAVSDFRHVLTFVVMLFAGVLISTLAGRMRRQSAAAREREHRTAALYSLTRALAGARDAQAIASVASSQIRDVFESEAVLLVADEEAPFGLSAPGASDLELADADRTVARWVLEHGRSAGRGLDTLPGARIIGKPLLAEGKAVGVLAVLPHPETRFDDPSQRHLLVTFVAQIALALERAQLAEEAKRAELRAETEEMRSSLLSSVSHDLRTPIGTVLGTATTMLDAGDTLGPEERSELTATIRDEAARLAHLVENLLEMTRVEAGGLEVHKEWVPIEELVGAVLNRFESSLEKRDVRISVPSELLAPVDPVLFEQVLVNLIENALKHTPPESPIEISAKSEDGFVAIEVADRGPGLPKGSEASIFEKFVRGEGRGRGVGLGLAICRGIVQVHGGTIEAKNRAGGGASFRVTLPLEGDPPRLPSEPASLGGGPP
jgi:two-component system sensor histidine kinase KdpD